VGFDHRSSALDYRKKNRNKIVKTIIQLLVLFLTAYALFHALVDVEKYDEPDKTEWTGDNGFIALSYFGVSRSGTPKLISKNELNKHLKALKDQGYETISQQDVLDYYEKGARLPEKALFLSFEDGRNDSALFAQKLLEKYNYKATFLSYANKMGNSDRKFVQPDDMKKMTRNGYWELGSNGYRLTYINIFDSEGEFIGMKDENELRNKMKIDYYNHYLMDFIRDENMIPTEDRGEMEERIEADYRLMEEIYEDELGYVPGAYMIMHANALNQGMNRLVSDANNENIKRIFDMHFNRDGFALNDRQDDVYDLTRVQPAPYWYTNHLLMKIRHDTGQDVRFVTGDGERAGKWNTLSGAAEFIEDRIALTSEPAGAGMLVLQDSESYRDIELSATLSGNVVGKQSLYARYDLSKDAYVKVWSDNNELAVEQKKPGQSAELLAKKKLAEFDWNETDLALNKATVYSLAETSEQDLTEETRYPVNVANERVIRLNLQGTKLRVAVDDEETVIDLEIDPSIGSGSVAVASEPNPLNERDEIYDGVFDGLEVRALNAEGEVEELLYSNRFTGIRKWIVEARRAFDSTVDWMIETF